MAVHRELSGQLGRYRILHKLGAGGMGAVYLVEDEPGRRVALKVPHFDEDADPAAVQRFQREARIASGIDHPHLCPVLDVGSADGVHYFTMPFIDGTPLSKLVGPGRPWPAPKAVELVRKLAAALAVLHERGIVHRDLKPANVMVRESGEPVLMDFGLARSFMSASEGLTSTGVIVGSPAYMSPEQVNNSKAVGPPADIYGLGMILYQMTTGVLPFEGMPFALFGQILTQPVPSPSSFLSRPDDALDVLCLRTLAKKPEDRYATMTAFAEAMAEYLADPGRSTMPEGVPFEIGETVPPHQAPSSLTTQYQRPTWFRSWKRWAAVGAALLCIAVGIVFVPKSASPSLPSDGDGKGTDEARKAVPAFVNSIGMKLRRIEAGTFRMGSPDGTKGGVKEKERFDREGPVHEVEITRPFYMAETETTLGQFRRFAEGKPYRTEANIAAKPATWHMNPHAKGDDYPVVYVSWNDAAAFCAWLSEKEKREYDLPTEAEWEYACRAGTSTPFHFGTQLNGTQANVNGNEPYGTKETGPHKKGPCHTASYPANAWGLFDMHGNVCEWCADGYRDYFDTPVKDPRGDRSRNVRSVRGGSWDSDAKVCRSAFRLTQLRTVANDLVGFRVLCRTIPIDGPVGD